MDIWRGVACLMIVVLHSTHVALHSEVPQSILVRALKLFISKFGSGVPIFFVISGYCIAATSDSIGRKPQAPRHFFYRRFRRIFPPYWVVVAIGLALSATLTAIGRNDILSGDYGYFPHPAALSWSQWVGNLTLTETWRQHFFGDRDLKILGVAWTLCYEEQFYAVCGFLLLISRRHFFLGTAAITVLTLITANLGLEHFNGLFLDGRWLMFAEGVLVYYALNYGKQRLNWIALVIVIFLLTVTVRYTPGHLSIRIPKDLLFELVISSMFAVLLMLLKPWDRALAEAKVLRPLMIGGLMCYSLYLIHWPITVAITMSLLEAGVSSFWGTMLITAPIAFAASLAAGWLLHVTVEQRFMNPPSNLERRTD
jgi:peptidoglycan/LPS O-acetylase OafA/YrhL